MRKRWLQAVWAAAVVGGASSAWATHPDYEGERGIEAHVALGYGTLLGTSDRVFLSPGEVTSGALDAFSGSFNARVGAGYRFLPYLSAGLSAGVQLLGAADQYSPSEARLGAHDAFVGYTVGLYGRLYLGSLLNGARHDPRVFFTSATDRRRFDPFVSLGVEFVQGIQRSRSYAEPQNLTSWTTTYVGIPIVLGGEYRLTTRFAVGLNLGLTPLVAGSTTKLSQTRDLRPGIDEIMRASTSYTPDASGNFNLWLGLTARYTLTF
jgi:hypothetical protein